MDSGAYGCWAAVHIGHFGSYRGADRASCRTVCAVVRVAPFISRLRIANIFFGTTNNCCGLAVIFRVAIVLADDVDLVHHGAFVDGVDCVLVDACLSFGHVIVLAGELETDGSRTLRFQLGRRVGALVCLLGNFGWPASRILRAAVPMLLTISAELARCS